jgi:hypothetical protein
MKGPGGRLRFDLRRVWECPICHRRDWTSGDIVFRACTCSGKNDPNHPVWMKLLEEELTVVAPRPPDLQSTPGETNVLAQSPPATTPNSDPNQPHQPEALAREENQNPTPPTPQ